MAARTTKKAPPGQQSHSGDLQVLARVLKEATKSGKYTIGTKEVISQLKSTKVVIKAGALGSATSAEKTLLAQAEKNGVPVVRVDKSSVQLGKMIGRPFRVSAIALRVVAEGDYRQLVGSQTAKTTE